MDIIICALKREVSHIPHQVRQHRMDISIPEAPPFGTPSIEYYAEHFHRKMIFQAEEQNFGIVFSSA